MACVHPGGETLPCERVADQSLRRKSSSQKVHVAFSDRPQKPKLFDAPWCKGEGGGRGCKGRGRGSVGREQVGVSSAEEANPSSNALAGRQADVFTSPGAGSHPALVSFRQHQSAPNSTDIFGRSLAPLQTLSDVTNARTRGVDSTPPPSGQTDFITSTGRAFEAGVHQPENFARARSNGQRLHSDGEELVCTAPLVQPGPSLPLSASPEDCVVWEYLQPSVYERPRGQSKRHVSASASKGRGRAASGQATRRSSVG